MEFLNSLFAPEKDCPVPAAEPSLSGAAAARDAGQAADDGGQAAARDAEQAADDGEQAVEATACNQNEDSQAPALVLAAAAESEERVLFGFTVRVRMVGGEPPAGLLSGPDDLVDGLLDAVPGWLCVSQSQPDSFTVFAAGSAGAQLASTREFQVDRLEPSAIAQRFVARWNTLLLPGKYRLTSRWSLPLNTAVADLQLAKPLNGVAMLRVQHDNAAALTRYFRDLNRYVEVDMDTPIVNGQHVGVVVAGRPVSVHISPGAPRRRAPAVTPPAVSNSRDPGTDGETHADESDPGDGDTMSALAVPIDTSSPAPTASTGAEERRVAALSECPWHGHPLKRFPNGLYQCERGCLDGELFHVCPRAPPAPNVSVAANGQKLCISMEQDATHELTQDPIRCVYCDGSAWCGWCGKLSRFAGPGSGDPYLLVCTNEDCEQHRKPYHMCANGENVAPSGKTFTFGARPRAFCPKCAPFSVSSLTRRPGM